MNETNYNDYDELGPVLNDAKCMYQNLEPELRVDIPEELVSEAEGTGPEVFYYKTKSFKGVEYKMAWQPDIDRLVVFSRRRYPEVKTVFGQTLMEAIIYYLQE